MDNQTTPSQPPPERDMDFFWITGGARVPGRSDPKGLPGRVWFRYEEITPPGSLYCLRKKPLMSIHGGKDPKMLYDGDAGTLIEKGDGVPEVAGSKYWMYTATKAVPAGVTVGVRIEAFDHPGNVGQETGTKQIVQ